MAKLPKRRHEQRCSHGPKIRFRSQAKARQAMLKHRNVVGKLSVYQCPNCEGWHITGLQGGAR